MAPQYQAPNIRKRSIELELPKVKYTPLNIFHNFFIVNHFQLFHVTFRKVGVEVTILGKIGFFSSFHAMTKVILNIKFCQNISTRVIVKAGVMVAVAPVKSTIEMGSF